MPEKNAELRRIRQRRDWANKTPEEKKESYRRDIEARKKKRENDPFYAEKMREKWRLAKLRKRLKHGDRVNEKQREDYRKNHEQRIQTIRNGKRRRNPTIGLASLERDVRAGRKDVRELIDRTLAALNECSALTNRRTRKGVSER